MTLTLARSLSILSTIAVLSLGASTGVSAPAPAAGDTAHQGERVSRSAERDPVVNTTIVLTDGAAVDTFVSDRPTLAAALAQHGLVLGAGDALSIPASSVLTGGDVHVSVNRATTRTISVEHVTAHTSRTVDDPHADAGTRTVTQAGVDGLTRSIYDVTSDAAGRELSRQLTLSITVRAPQEEIVAVGTKPIPTLVPVTPPAPPAPVPAPAGSGGSARQLGAAAVAARGWGPDQFACLDQLWSAESGWNPRAANRSSGAYGIPQSLPGSKMASAGADWATNPATQIAWGLSYITARYGTPCGAWAHWQSAHSY